MTIKTKSYLGASFMVLIAFALSIGFAYANPSYFMRAQTDTATTTVTYMTPGTATTTLTFDAGASSGAGSTDAAALFIYLTASSTNTTLNWGYEYSQDGSSWFKDSDIAYGTTTQTYTVTSPIQYQWAYASTTLQGAASQAALKTASKIIKVPTPARFVRVVFSLATGGTNGAVWAEIDGKRQAQ